MICETRDSDDEGSNRLASLSSILPSMQSYDLANAQPIQVNRSLGCKDFRSLGVTTADCRQVVSVGRFLVTNAMRQVLSRQVGGSPWSAQDVEHFQTVIERAAVQIRGRIEKLQESEPEPSWTAEPSLSEQTSPQIGRAHV